MHEEYRFYVDRYVETCPQIQALMHEVSHHVANRGSVRTLVSG
jgi:hypothetical protein